MRSKLLLFVFVTILCSLTFSQSTVAQAWRHYGQNVFGKITFELYAKTGSWGFGQQFFGANCYNNTFYDIHVTGEFVAHETCGNEGVSKMDFKIKKYSGLDRVKPDSKGVADGYLSDATGLIGSANQEDCIGKEVLVDGYYGKKTRDRISSLNIRNLKLMAIQDDGSEVPVSENGELLGEKVQTNKITKAPAEATHSSNVSINPPSNNRQNQSAGRTNEPVSQTAYAENSTSENEVAGQTNTQETVTANVAPPELPEYEQPACPTEGYLWQPGYWAFDLSNGFYWVPGVWTAPPAPDLLWTPGYWSYNNGDYTYTPGYWGVTVGFYGGINYGFGYAGSGYNGGIWIGHSFRYNTAVVNVNTTVIQRTYVDKTVIVNNVTINHASYNGRGGVISQPNTDEIEARKERHLTATNEQLSHQHDARANTSQYFRTNNGHPTLSAINRVGYSPKAEVNQPIANQAANENSRSLNNSNNRVEHPSEPNHPAEHPAMPNNLGQHQTETTVAGPTTLVPNHLGQTPAEPNHLGQRPSEPAFPGTTPAMPNRLGQHPEVPGKLEPNKIEPNRLGSYPNPQSAPAGPVRLPDYPKQNGTTLKTSEAGNNLSNQGIHSAEMPHARTLPMLPSSFSNRSTPSTGVYSRPVAPVSQVTPTGSGTGTNVPKFSHQEITPRPVTVQPVTRPVQAPRPEPVQRSVPVYKPALPAPRPVNKKKN